MLNRKTFDKNNDDNITITTMSVKKHVYYKDWLKEVV